MIKISYVERFKIKKIIFVFVNRSSKEKYLPIFLVDIIQMKFATPNIIVSVCVFYNIITALQ